MIEPASKDTRILRFAPSTRLCLWILGLLLLATGIALRTPIMTTGVRAIVAVTLIFACYVGLVHLVRLIQAHPTILYPAVFFIGLLTLWGTLASKLPDGGTLRTSYVKELRQSIGDTYVWGGETHSGIDCSGLARTAFWRAMLKEGIRELNPYLLGARLWEFWWRDMTADDMLNKKYGYTVKVGSADKLAGYDSAALKPGDLAIAGNGSHVLIYVGGNEWIEANPDDGKVVANKATAGSKRPYFNSPVTFMRWWILKDQ